MEEGWPVKKLAPPWPPVHRKLAPPLIIIIVSYQHSASYRYVDLQYRQKNRTYNVACSSVVGLHIIKYTTPT